ncbi:hypothetical protein VE03_06707 [Pseudogymnoascus sp. 23342-1-I1]|nr:hypothetical protein VE03_06707 [Pseudogymnoascus sp. 23342-1-I1]
MSDNSALKRLYRSPSSSASATDTPTTTTATTPDPSQSRRESEHDDPSTAFNPAKVSSKLTSLAASARAAAEDTFTTLPGSDEGHPTDPLLRVYDPSKDENLSIEQLLARPRLPRTPFERATMGKLQVNLEVAANGGAEGELGTEEQLAAKKLLEQADEALKKADREKHMKLIRGMATDLDVSYAARK